MSTSIGSDLNDSSTTTTGTNLLIGLLAVGVLINEVGGFEGLRSDSTANAEAADQSADAPGKPTEEDGFMPSKRPVNTKDGRVKNPNRSGRGWLDVNGSVWVPTGPAGSLPGTTGLAHGGRTGMFKTLKLESIPMFTLVEGKDSE